MSVTVSLLKLVLIPDTREAWPEEFEGLIAKLEEEPDNRQQWSVVGDWCQDQGEEDLALAFIWVANAPNVSARRVTNNWVFRGLPNPLTAMDDRVGFFGTTLPQLAARLAARLRKLEAILKGQG